MNPKSASIEYLYIDSPPGRLEISILDEKVISIRFKKPDFSHEPHHNKAISLMNEVKRQFEAYLSGKQFVFDLPLSINGTPFQQRVWEQLQQIPFGKTISYAQLAHNMGDPKCIRAAAAANGKNPLAIVIPCHRVIGTDGAMTGYAGGIERKRWLLQHENLFANGLQLLF